MRGAFNSVDRIATCVLRTMPSLASRWDTYFFTVFSARNICSPIWRLVRPSPIRSRTVRSWSLNPASGPTGSAPRRIRARTAAVAVGSSNDPPAATVRTAVTRSRPRISLSR